ncbi:MAG: Nramp family divalent metal transporter [Rubrobacteraceae bacterium]
MADVTGSAGSGTVGGAAAPATFGGKVRLVGPGLVIAATGVGAGDLISSLVAGTRFGTAFIWAIIIGALIKFSLVEGLGRLYMATGQTILQGWHSLGRPASGYFVVYLFLVTFVFGAAVNSAAALGVDAMFPNVLPIWAWAVIHAVFGLVVVGIGRYGLFERVMEVFIGLMFVTVVGLAILLLPNLGNLASGLVPTLPKGSLLYALGLIGGVSGTFTLASYTYWVRERGWRQSAWIPTMRIDLSVGYIVTGVFMVSMLIIGTQLLFGTGATISGSEGLVAVADPLEERFGVVARWLFLIGFWSAVTSSIIGAWNGAAYLFADYVKTVRRVPEEQAEDYLSEQSPFFRVFLLWITFPPWSSSFSDNRSSW